jgi:flagellar basal-body rod modification protein FlgD
MLDSVSLSLGGVAGVDTTATNNARDSLATNYSQFLTLLTTQLKNQDPLNPMNSQDFTNQLISLSGVEQQISQTSKLNDLLQVNQASAVNSALGYIGKQVDYVGGTMQYDGNPVEVKYSLASAATQAKISIADANGNVVYTSDAELTAGGHSFDWDGKDSSGNALAKGDYTVTIGAVDKDGTSIKSYTIVPATVTGVETLDGQVYLNIGDQKVSIGSVEAVREMPTAATTPTTTT